MESFVAGPAGKIEVVRWLPEGAPRAAAIVCHPHPHFGGTLHNSVVYRIARALQREGLAVMRFNFRGVGASEGTSAATDAEIGDAAAVLDDLARSHPGLPLWVAGYSFGARTALGLAARESRVARVIAVALAVLAFDVSALREVRQPGLVLQAGADAFGTLADLRAAFPSIPATFELDEIPGADHLFTGKTPIVEARVADYARRTLERSES